MLLLLVLQVFSSLGHWSTAVYIILAMHAVPVWLVGTLLMLRYVFCIIEHHSIIQPSRLSKLCPLTLVWPLAWLVSVPQVLMLLTTTAILLPSLGKYVEVSLMGFYLDAASCSRLYWRLFCAWDWSSSSSLASPFVVARMVSSAAVQTETFSCQLALLP